MKIMADSPCLYSPTAKENDDLIIIPSCTILSGVAYRDIEEMTTEEFLKRIDDGEIATSSQPAVGEVLDVYEELADNEEILVLPIGDGLSGTYQNMVSAKNLSDNGDNIHIMDTKTLAGPQKYLVEKAMKLRDSGLGIEEIKKALKVSIDSSMSFVIPSDFNFLKRSGRLTPFAAKIGTIMKIVPVMTQTEDKKKITKFCIKMSKKSALDAVIQHLKDVSVDKDYLVTVCHGGVEQEAEETLNILRESFDGARLEMHLLPPSLVCHGGPGCILIQAIKL